MTWAEYYERYDGWQESTQYSRLASIKDFGPDGSPSEEICDCIQYPVAGSGMHPTWMSTAFR